MWHHFLCDNSRNCALVIVAKAAKIASFDSWVFWYCNCETLFLIIPHRTLLQDVRFGLLRVVVILATSVFSKNLQLRYYLILTASGALVQPTLLTCQCRLAGSQSTRRNKILPRRGLRRHMRYVVLQFFLIVHNPLQQSPKLTFLNLLRKITLKEIWYISVLFLECE